MLYFFFFFFQAEDGIRDRNVTGVQTCALPISSRNGVAGECGGRPVPLGPPAQARAYTHQPSRPAVWTAREIGRASCRERGVDGGGGRTVEKKEGETRRRGTAAWRREERERSRR